MVRTKVFVGNLSFNTKENELTKEFETAGKVISANIITRGPRSLGYGFVEMDNEADAENAVKLLNKKEIDGRPINVEVAKKREEGAEGEQQSASGEGRGRGRGGRGTRGRGRGGARRGGFRRQEDGEENTGDNSAQGEGRRGGFRGRGNGPRGAPRGTRGSGAPGRGGSRPPREERRQEDRTPSQTTLFIANLPFTLEDEGFGKVLKEAQLAFKTAHVVKKKSGKSKGFGFIEFENEADQQKALAALNNKTIEGRDLVAKVALTENRTEGSPASPAQTTEATK